MAKELSEETKFEIRTFRELKSLSGSGLPCKSVTTVRICCLQVREVVRASLKFFAALNGVSTALRPSTLALGSDGKKI